jgi:drug/metabolite transporter (DMT)-like permease
MNAIRIAGWLAIIGVLGLIAGILFAFGSLGTTITGNYIIGVSLVILALAALTFFVPVLVRLVREAARRTQQQQPPPPTL